MESVMGVPLIYERCAALGKRKPAGGGCRVPAGADHRTQLAQLPVCSAPPAWPLSVAVAWYRLGERKDFETGGNSCLGLAGPLIISQGRECALPRALSTSQHHQ